MHISIFTPKYPPDVGGAATYSRLISDELSEVDEIESITIVTTTHPDERLVVRSGTVSIYRVLPRTTVEEGFERVLRFLLKQGILFLTILLLSWRSERQIFQIHSTIMFVGRDRYNFLLDWYLLVLSKVFNSASILDVRDQHTIPDNPRAFSLIICASQNIRSRFASSTADPPKIITLPVPINIEKIKDHETSDQLALNLTDEYICFVGDISREKGVQQLVEATDLVEDPPRVVLVGSPVDETGRDILSSLPTSVRYLGPRSHDEALQIIDEAKLVVLPSASEGMPRVALEALTLGTPIALTAHIPEFDSSESVLMLPDNSVESLSSLLSNVPEAESVTYPIETHNAETIGNRLRLYYQKLASQSSNQTLGSNEL